MKQLTTSQKSLYVGAWFYFPALPVAGTYQRLIWFRDVNWATLSDLLLVNIGGAFYIAIDNATPAGGGNLQLSVALTLQPNNWYWLELYTNVDATAGVVTAWLGTSPTTYSQVATLTGQDIGVNNTSIVTVGISGLIASFVVDEVNMGDSFIAPTGVSGNGILTVSATANGSPVTATFTAGGQSQSGTTATFSLPANIYTVSATYGGTTLTQNLTVTSGGTTTYNFDFTAPPPPSGNLVRDHLDSSQG